MELFDIGNGKAVCSNPGGRFHGWMFFKHPNGQYVSERKLATIDPYPADHPFAALFGAELNISNEPERSAVSLNSDNTTSSKQSGEQR